MEALYGTGVVNFISLECNYYEYILHSVAYHIEGN